VCAMAQQPSPDLTQFKTKPQQRAQIMKELQQGIASAELPK